MRVILLLRFVARLTLVLFFGGKRSKALEELLPAMEREGLLLTMWHSGKKVYFLPRKDRVIPVSIEHEITCAFILVLLWLCRKEEGEILPERKFRGFGIVPEGGIRYSKERKTMLVFEYCTRSNFTHGGVMKSKITRYIKYLPAMEGKFERKITVLFVIDVERQKVKEFVKKIGKLSYSNKFLEFDGSWEPTVGFVADGDQSAPYGGDRFPLYPFFFIDYETFRSIPIGEALTAKKYFWRDGAEWRLTGND